MKIHPHSKHIYCIAEALTVSNHSADKEQKWKSRSTYTDLKPGSKKIIIDNPSKAPVIISKGTTIGQVSISNEVPTTLAPSSLLNETMSVTSQKSKSKLNSQSEDKFEKKTNLPKFLNYLNKLI